MSSLSQIANQLKEWKDKLASGSERPVGVDLGSVLIKTIKLDGKRELLFSHLNSQESDDSSTFEDLKRKFQSEKIAGGRAAFSIADERVELHEFKLPKLSDTELKTAIEWEIKKTVAGAEFTYHEVLTYPTESGVDVQCVVASKDVVQDRFDTGMKCGLQPRSLETESSALLAAASFLMGTEKLDRAVIVDLGYSSYRLIFVHEGRVSFTRSLYFGVGSLCKQVGDQLGYISKDVTNLLKQLHVPAAEEAVTVDSPNKPVVTQFFQESLYSLCEEFRKSEAFMKEQKALSDVDKVLLCGGGACFPFTEEFLKRQLADREVLVLNPLKSINEVPGGFDRVSGPLWVCALGLALRESA